MRLLRHLTSGTIPVGSFVASSDGKTPRTGLALQTAGDLQLLIYYPNGVVSSLAGSTWIEPAAKGGMYHLRYQGTTLASTIGHARLFSARSSWIPVSEDYQIVPQRRYDSLFANGTGLPTVTAAYRVQSVAGSVRFVAGSVRYVAGSVGYVKGSVACVAGRVGYVAGSVGYVAGSVRYVASSVGYVAGLNAALQLVQDDTTLIVADTGTDGVLLASSGALFVDGVPLEHTLSYIQSALINKAAVNTGTGTVLYKDRAGTSTLVTVVYDTDGNRTTSTV